MCAQGAETGGRAVGLCCLSCARAGVYTLASRLLVVCASLLALCWAVAVKCVHLFICTSVTAVTVMMAVAACSADGVAKRMGWVPERSIERAVSAAGMDRRVAR